MTSQTDHQRILEWIKNGDWRCSTELDFMRDARKRMSELNKGYSKDNPRIEGIPCDGRCGKTHKSKTLKMRRLNPNLINVSLTPQNPATGLVTSNNAIPAPSQSPLFTYKGLPIEI